MNMKVKQVNEEFEKYEEDYFKNRKFENKYYYMAIQYLLSLKPKKVFDYGCGEGFFVHAFNYFNTPCYGFDISKYATEHAYGLANGKVGLNIPKNYNPDIVICMDVLEHINKIKEQDIIDYLTLISKKYIIVSVCDVIHSKVYVDSTHCNIRTMKYWEHQFIKRGWESIPVPSDWLFKEHTLLFKKKEMIKDAK